MFVCAQGRSSVRFCENLSKLHEFVKEEELKLPGSTTSLEEDLQVLNKRKISQMLCNLLINEMNLKVHFYPFY